MKIVPCRIPRPGVVPAGHKLIHRRSPNRLMRLSGRIHGRRAGQPPTRLSSDFPSAIPLFVRQKLDDICQQLDYNGRPYASHYAVIPAKRSSRRFLSHT
jgi:hypothetical protein